MGLTPKKKEETKKRFNVLETKVNEDGSIIVYGWLDDGRSFDLEYLKWYKLTETDFVRERLEEKIA